jgi:hypothetical protein
METEGAADAALQPLVNCRVCQTPTAPEDLTHLKIYVAGSEGVDVCFVCRQTLTEVLRGMMRANIAGSKRGYLAAKQVAMGRRVSDSDEADKAIDALKTALDNWQPPASNLSTDL